MRERNETSIYEDWSLPGERKGKTQVGRMGQNEGIYKRNRRQKENLWHLGTDRLLDPPSVSIFGLFVEPIGVCAMHFQRGRMTQRVCNPWCFYF